MVSVIIPVYNVKKYLPECVESVRKQTLTDIEIILVDDGSTDGSSELCDSFAKEDERILVIHQKNGGSTSARNAGLLASQGTFIGFVDSDDWIEPNMYNELLRYCVENDADIVASVKYFNHENSEQREKLEIPEGIYEKGDSGKLLIKNLIYSEDYRSGGITPNLCDKLFKKELLSRYQLKLDEKIKYGEDDVCVYSCLLNADRVVVVDKAYYHYRMREGSICHSADDMYFDKITRFYLQLKKEFQTHTDADILMEQLKRHMLEFVLRGINKHFGFGYGIVIPFYWPPFEKLCSANVSTLVLYGAGNVGQDYYRAFQLLGTIRIVAWVDKQYRNYQKNGLSVDHISKIDDMEYDAILIATDNERLSEQIRDDLVERGIAREKIIYGKPHKIIQDIGKEKKNED